MIDASTAFILAVTIFAFCLPILLYFPPVPPSKRDALLETHIQVGVKPSESGLRGSLKDSRRGVRNDAQQPAAAAAAKIRSLWIYPLKSCKGIEVRQSRVLPTGLELDRLYTFAQLKSPFPAAAVQQSAAGKGKEKEKEKEEWHFITQRQFPLLATVQVDLFVPDLVKTNLSPSPTSSSKGGEDAFLLVRFPWQERGVRGVLALAAAKLARGWRARPEKEFVLPVAFPSTEDEIAARGYAREDVTIWKDTVTALNMEPELPRELALYLGVSNRLGLFRVDPARLRNVYRCAPPRGEAGYQPVAGFQDAVSDFFSLLFPAPF
jgi:hypothetical protein